MDQIYNLTKKKKTKFMNLQLFKLTLRHQRKNKTEHD